MIIDIHEAFIRYRLITFIRFFVDRLPLSFPAKTYLHTFTAREVLGQTSGMDHSYIDCTAPPLGQGRLHFPRQVYHQTHTDIYIFLLFLFFITEFSHIL